MGSWSSKECPGSSTQAALLGQEEPTESVILESSSYVVVALYNYPTGHPAHCSIRAGERLDVLSDEGEWWKVSSSATGNESYIPSNYTARVYHRWQYEGLSRKKAEELLLLPYNQTGSFLVRESQTRPGANSLSVRKSSDQDRRSVKHYRIQQLDNGWHYISPGLTFPNLRALVDHYSEVADGLCSLLGEPCFIQGSNNVPVVTGSPPMSVRKPTLNWKDMDSSMIFGKDKGQDNEDSLVSEGLREAIKSYRFMTEDCKGCSQKWDS
ncbi:src-like-adapter 2 isoform X1 [Coregonus clupeaformis]|uniref:Src-like-adapter 2 n=1 Tax=Coregonus suidteri TaxID=861788 RepID=A0AAN8L494_9TELE|nr:src-like-adapter 2 isoform X1 [Coregonus clupeaformis]